jgi:hypothetical protein
MEHEISEFREFKKEHLEMYRVIESDPIDSVRHVKLVIKSNPFLQESLISCYEGH